MKETNIAIGTKIPCRVNRTLDSGDFSLLHQLTWFNTSIHSNAEYAKETLFKERPLAAPVTFAVADGLIHHANSFAELLGEYGYGVYAYAGVDSIKNTKPVLFGDTLRADAEIIDFSPAQKPNLFKLKYRNRVFNQRNEQVVEYTSTLLVIKRAKRESC